MIKRFFSNSTAYLLYLIVVLLGIGVFAFLTSESKDKVLKNENVKASIKLGEFRYRDELVASFQSYLASSNFKLIDSLATIDKAYNPVKKFLIKEFLSSKSEKIFRTYSSYQPILLVSYDSVKTTLSIKEEAIEDIEENINLNKDFTDTLRYGNIIETKSKIRAVVNFDILALLIGGLLILKILIDFIFVLQKSRNEKISYVEFDEEVNSLEKRSIESENPNLSDKEKKITLQELQNELKNLKSKIEPLVVKTNSIDDIQLESFKIERISKQFHEKSNILLAIAFIIAAVGIAIFYFILPELNKGVSVNEYLAISLRPIFILAFFQTLSFFIFKQYRVSVSDYKFFYREYQEKKALITAYKLLKEEGFSENQLLSAGKFSSINGKLLETDQSEETETLLQQLKLLLKKDE